MFITFLVFQSLYAGVVNNATTNTKTEQLKYASIIAFFISHIGCVDRTNIAKRIGINWHKRIATKEMKKEPNDTGMWWRNNVLFKRSK